MHTTIIGPPWLRGIVIVDPDRLAGTLICGGGIIGLIGSVASLSLLLGVPSFALVLLLGIYSFRRRKEGRLLAGGVLWFAILGTLGAFPSGFALFGYGFLLANYYFVAEIPVLGMALALAGAVIKLQPSRG